MALFRKKDPEPAPAPEPTPAAPKGSRKKEGPTPTRRQAEAARLQRINPQMSKKEARRRNAEANRKQRMSAMEERDGTPERKLMRDFVDSRWSLGEFLLPAMMIFLALSFLQSQVPSMSMVSLGLMYAYILFTLFDLFVMWRKYKRIAAERFPGLELKGKGVMMFGFNRSIQMRRLRMPRPVVKRGGAY
ncbi:DUF3043 domain-containing protein [Ammonicoccus fulvus]|uniref:DUF3043 domain-containing protein n=1 Tax=Ammonicoccus fulvus TaxID=3138240 RepID=A0ABZ3FUD6_9ACTN